MLIMAAWLITGPFFGFSDTWQLVINTGTTIVTFLMVFLIQNTQNRDARGDPAQAGRADPRERARRNALADLEELTDEELDEFQRQFKQLRARGIARGVAAAKASERASPGPSLLAAPPPASDRG